MKGKIVAFTVVSASLLLSGFATSAFSKNLAKGATVAASGQFFIGGWGQGLTTDFSTLTDGMFFKKGHQWDQGPVWWDQSQNTAQPFLTVFLGPRLHSVNMIRIQVDNNDDYLVSWNDARPQYAATNPQQVVIVPNRHGGMDVPITKRINAVTDSFRIEHYTEGAGDNLYSVSEFQAYGW